MLLDALPDHRRARTPTYGCSSPARATSTSSGPGSRRRSSSAWSSSASCRDETKARAFVSADIYVAPNTGGESFGIVLLESMASGTPVLASDLEAFRRVARRGPCGGVVRQRGPGRPRPQRRSPCSTTRCERARLRVRASSASREFDWATVAQRVVEVYEAVTVTGEKVTEDFRGQVIGRLSRGERGD